MTSTVQTDARKLATHVRPQYRETPEPGRRETRYKQDCPVTPGHEEIIAEISPQTDNVRSYIGIDLLS